MKTFSWAAASDYCLSVAVGIFLLAPFFPGSIALASSHYTTKQLDALASRVGTIYWIAAVENRTPAFFAAPARNAAPFSPGDNESFEITELTGQKDKEPYYKVKFDSGKEGYIRPETFLEEINLTILIADPRAEEKKKAAAAAVEEEKRVEWILSRPWSPAVKEAALKRQPVPGFTPTDVRRIFGEPLRISKATGRLTTKGQQAPEERWHYPDGKVFIFYQNLLNRVEAGAGKTP